MSARVVGVGLLVAAAIVGVNLLALLVTAAAAGLPTISSAEALARPGPIDRGRDADAADLIGTKAPRLPDLRWLDGKKRTGRALEGRVVLVRSFTNACPFCAASMPTLERIHRDYADRGLVVLGVYHPKPPRRTSSADVAEFARSLGTTFPVAVDPTWRLVKRWWLDGADRPWTSITWLLDADGTIRYIHPGGEYHVVGGADHDRCREDERAIRRAIEELLD